MQSHVTQRLRDTDTQTTYETDGMHDVNEPNEVTHSEEGTVRISLEEIIQSAVRDHELACDDYCHTYRSPMFTLVRRLKTLARVDADPRRVFCSVNQIIDDFGGWRVFDTSIEGVGGEEDAEIQFVDTWHKVKYAEGESPLEHATRMAILEPLPFKREHLAATSTTYLRFLSLAAYLQVAAGEQPILLPCAKVGQALGVTKMTVSRMIHLAVRVDKLVILVADAERANHKAAQYRFDLSRDPSLRAALFLCGWDVEHLFGEV